MTPAWHGLPPRAWRFAILAGAAIGITYALSPLTVWFAIAAVAIVRWAERGLPADERLWVRTMLVAAIALRVLAVLALFSATDHGRVPFGTFFGDEDFFIKRSIWLRNLALGVPIHPADLIYAFDEVGRTSYLYALAWLQLFTGPSPYGVHLVGIAFYVAAVVLLFRLTYRTLGHMPAFAGLALLMFLPTLFVWSVSALKESAFILLTACAIAMSERLVRTRGWARRVATLAVLVSLAAVAESVRRIGAFFTAASLALGLACAAIVSRPRVVLGTAVLAPMVIGAVLSRPAAQLQAYRVVKMAADQQRGYISTPGYAYKTLDDRFYISARDIDDMRFFEAGRFVIRAFVDYMVVPLPWQVASRASLGYLPEQIVWYVMIALLPFGFVASLHRDALVASVLLAFAVVSAGLVALISGNVGTLVRHRGMVIPYIVWMSAVAACDLLSRAGRRSITRRIESSWP